MLPQASCGIHCHTDSDVEIGDVCIDHVHKTKSALPQASYRVHHRIDSGVEVADVCAATKRKLKHATIEKVRPKKS